MKLYFQTVALLAILAFAYGYPEYQNKIPNGDKVPSPCDPSTYWPGVGHESPQGKGPRNPFGLDFDSNGHTWSKTFCQMDSDGDELTNGQELGDPNCVWKEGATPTSSKNLSHPGICEPLSSTKCTGRNLWLKDCGPGILNCSKIHAPGVKNTTINFPTSLVPNVETTYICRTFLFPNDSDYDIIAVEPVIDNVELTHHMILYGCIDAERDHYTKNEAFPCTLDGGHNCPALIGLWAAGMQGQCFTDKAGLRIGPNGYQYARLQIHWNNPKLKTGQYDASGMRLYYKGNVSENRLQIFMTGQMYLEIPPNREQVTQIGSCTPICSKQNKGNLNITSVFLHMHHLGRSGDISLYRNGSLVQVLQNVTYYDYMMPEQVSFDPPVVMFPGDEIRLTCNYRSIGKNTTTYYGEPTSDEMCFGFITYYPQMDLYYFCGQWKSITGCGSLANLMYEKCNFTKFLSDVLSLNKSCSGNCGNPICESLTQCLCHSCLGYPDARSFVETFMPGTASTLMNCMFPQTHEPSTCPTNQPVPSYQPLVTKSHDSKSHAAEQSFSFGTRILLCIALILIYR